MTEAEVKAMIDAAIRVHAETAFVDGDGHGHKRAHRIQIDDHRARNKRKEDILNKIVTGAAWAIFVGVCYAIWTAIKTEVAK